MADASIEDFARLLVEMVRDRAIRSCDTVLSEDHVIAKRWQAAAAETPEALARVVIADVVDSTIGQLLNAIDQGVIPLVFKAADGSTVDLSAVSSESGELSGYYRGPGGWVESYSGERQPDDFSDLETFFDGDAIE